MSTILQKISTALANYPARGKIRGSGAGSIEHFSRGLSGCATGTRPAEGGGMSAPQSDEPDLTRNDQFS